MFPKKRMWSHDFEDDNTYGKVVAMLDQLVFMVVYDNLSIIFRATIATRILSLLLIVLR